MDGAGASYRYLAVGGKHVSPVGVHAPTSRRAAVVCVEGWGASLAGAATGADLGGSSKYSNENFED